MLANCFQTIACRKKNHLLKQKPNMKTKNYELLHVGELLPNHCVYEEKLPKEAEPKESPNIWFECI